MTTVMIILIEAAKRLIVIEIYDCYFKELHHTQFLDDDVVDDTVVDDNNMDITNDNGSDDKDQVVVSEYQSAVTECQL